MNTKKQMNCISLKIILLSLIPNLVFSQLAWEYHYVYNKPLSPMNYTFNNVNGLFMGFTYAPNKSNYNIGLGYQLGFYGNKVQSIEFPVDSINVRTKLRINNACHSVFIYHKYKFVGAFENNRFEPFIDAKTGWAFFRTDLSIDDPENVLTP